MLIPYLLRANGMILVYIKFLFLIFIIIQLYLKLSRVCLVRYKYLNILLGKALSKFILMLILKFEFID